MKTIDQTATFAELTSTRDQIDDAASRLYLLQRTACEADTPEGRLLAAQLWEIQLAAAQIKDQINRVANCYTG